MNESMDGWRWGGGGWTEEGKEGWMDGMRERWMTVGVDRLIDKV